MEGAFMYPESRTIRGLNIATVILSGLGVFFGLLFLLMSFMASAALSDPAMVNQMVDQLLSSSSGTSSAFDGNSAYSYSYDYSNMSGDEARVVVSSTGPLLIILSVGYLACRAVALVASILALRNYNNPAKLGGAFGWAIAAIVLQVFTGSLASAVLFIISAVFISKLRRAYRAGAYTDGAGSQGGTPQPPVA